MDVALLASLAALALIDSTSFGTLLIPIWFLLDPGPVRPGRILVFLGTVAAFYYVLGLAIALGAGAFVPWLTRLLDTPAAAWAQLILGAGLFLWSFRLDGGGGGSRLVRWRDRALGGGNRRLIRLACTAAAAEVTTMLPYLGAIGLITTARLPAPSVAVLMAGYCLVMIVPALALLGVRLAAGDRIGKVLTRIADWMTTTDTLGWIVGLLGFLLVSDAVPRVGRFTP